MNESLTNSSELKIFVSVDMEGISGIVHPSQTGSDPTEYELGRTLMAKDVNAAIEGMLSAGVSEIVVSDGHGHKRNIRAEDLHESAVLVRGSPKPLAQMEGIDSAFDAVILIGYHAKRGTKYGIIDHTISSRVVDSVLVNGVEMGEMGLNAGIAGYYGIPLIFVSGDLAVTREVEALLPQTITVAVKEAVSRTAAKCLHPNKARLLIKQGVLKAIKSRDRIQPYIINPPIVLIARFIDSLMADVAENMPCVERLDGKTIRIQQDDYLHAVRALRASIMIASTVTS
jgi:D-amino peptidase